MRLDKNFYQQDALDLAPKILGTKIMRVKDGKKITSVITEVEIYRGFEDQASHAFKGKTERNKIMFSSGGYVYVYLIYGMYWLINVVTGPADHPQALLLRGLKDAQGPGLVGKFLGLDKTFYGEDLTKSKRIWLEEGDIKLSGKFYITKPRVGISYAGKWAKKPWRFVLK